jgi:hypothetical protein
LRGDDCRFRGGVGRERDQGEARGPWHRSLAVIASPGGSHTSALRHYSLAARLNPLAIEHLDDL